MREPVDVHELRFGRCRMSVPEAVAFIGRSERTWRYWIAHGFPDWVLRMLRLKGGYLGDIHSDWRDWHIVEGRIYGPGDRYGLSPGEILAIHFQRQLLAELKRRLHAYESQNAEKRNGVRLLSFSDSEKGGVTRG